MKSVSKFKTLKACLAVFVSASLIGCGTTSNETSVSDETAVDQSTEEVLIDQNSENTGTSEDTENDSTEAEAEGFDIPRDQLIQAFTNAGYSVSTAFDDDDYFIIIASGDNFDFDVSCYGFDSKESAAENWESLKQQKLENGYSVSEETDDLVKYDYDSSTMELLCRNIEKNIVVSVGLFRTTQLDIIVSALKEAGVLS